LAIAENPETNFWMNLKDLRLEVWTYHPIHLCDFAENGERLFADPLPARCEGLPTGRDVIRLIQNAPRAGHLAFDGPQYHNAALGRPR